MKKEQEKFELDEKEKQLIQQKRDLNSKKLECTEKIQEILKEYGATLLINPNSPIGNPQIIINL